MADRNSIKRIHKLPDDLVNQIAAGEVIERPASVVKELLENSLDAGATKITLEIKGGGSQLIRVHDNGFGIHQDDLLLAIDRHTTSKLGDVSDLFNITTLGFRGEALSSIAAVSRLNLTSRQNESTHGWSINLDTTSAPKPAAHPAGTTVEVQDLFFNTPARRKFLRTEKTEFIHIQELVKRVVLSRFNLALNFINEGRRVITLSDDHKEPVQRVENILGKRFLNGSIFLEQRLGDMSLYGWAGLPEIARSQNDQQYFYLNGRIIKDKLINHAVRMAYGDDLYPGRHPAYLLFLEMDHAAADINVHPTKHEVRFRDSRNVHDFIYGSLSRHLSERHSSPGRNNTGKAPVISENNKHRSGNIPVREMASSYKTQSDSQTNIEQPYGFPVAQIKGKFLITEIANGIILHDIYRMREIITWFKLKNELDSGKIKFRPVLVPLVLSVEDKIFDLIEYHTPILEKAGLSIEPASHTAIQIRTLPSLLSYADPLNLVKSIIVLLERNGFSPLEPEKLLSLLSEHANDISPSRLNMYEMNSILMVFYSIKDQISDLQFGKAVRPIDLNALQELLDG